MAQLPPKSPTLPQKWPSFASQLPSCMDDFIDFASNRRNPHRRSSNDPIAFVEASANECGFERLDDDQLSSMFSNEAEFQSLDQNSDNEEGKLVMSHQLKNEPGEVEDRGYDKEMESVKAPSIFSCDGGSIVDPKRVKRILANRQSAQRSRVRKLHYISELERSVTTLQTEVSTLSPRVAFLDHQRLVLNIDNSSLKQRIAALVQDKIFKDAHQEALRKEIERLRRVYHEQNMNKLDTNTNTTDPPSSLASPPRSSPPPVSLNGTDIGSRKKKDDI